MGLDHAYQYALERIHTQGAGSRELAMQVLMWVAFAMRPLTELELQHALAIEFGDSVFDDANIPSREDILSPCAGLVVLDQASNIIRLVHCSTLEYLRSTQHLWFPTKNLAPICLTYLSLDVFKRGFCPNDDELNDRLNNHPFPDYAATYWGEHMRENKEPEVQQLAESFLSCQEFFTA